VSSDADFLILRRFDKLNARVLLTLQGHIVQLEEELQQLDAHYRSRNTGDVNNGCVRDDETERPELLDRIANKLTTYRE
jgi:hypothetical protein